MVREEIGKRIRRTMMKHWDGQTIAGAVVVVAEGWLGLRGVGSG